MKLSVLPIIITPEKIGFLKFILEAYDGLALMSTRNPQTGEVDIFYPAELKEDVCDLVESLTSSLLIKYKKP